MVKRAKEIYLYSPIYDFVAESIMQQIEENSDNEISMRMNTPGGNVFAGWGMCAKVGEHGNVGIKVDGCAASFGAFLLLYANKTESLDVSTFMLHRAHMRCEDDEDRALLAKVNKDLRAKMEAKLDDAKLQKLKGVSIANLFEDEKRIDLFLSADEAKEIGLIQKVKKCNPAELTAFNERFKIAAYEPENDTQKTENTMTTEKLKAEFPLVYASIVEAAEKAGVAKERERVKACLVFLEVDAKGVKTLIENGKDLTQVEMAEFALKSVSAKKLEGAEADSAATQETAATDTKEASEKDKELAKAEAEYRKACGLK
jgi:ATP-dependent protease ClpP protease subunit